MKKEYDFTKGERGRFYRKNLKLNIPVYLEDKNLSFVEKVARKRDVDISQVVNDLIESDIKIVESTGS